MKKYIGTKTIMAKPMAKSEAEKVLNRSLADAKGGEDGYLVEYPDGYKSWSPKETFEEAYKVADTYLDRMRIEYADVKERVLKLHTFLMSEEFRALPKEKRAKLQAQCGAMSAYVEILGQRIDEAKMEQMPQEAAQAAAAAQKMRESLVGESVGERNGFLRLRFHDTPGGLPDEAWIPRYLLLKADMPGHLVETVERDETEEELDRIFGFD